MHVASLRSFNNVRGNLINAGQQLRIPSKANGTSAAAVGRRTVVAANEITHRVNRGDTLWRIANRYGISVEHIRRENRQAGEFLQVGQVLKFSKG